MRVFVYGTLKRGGVGYFSCGLDKQRYVGTANAEDVALLLVGSTIAFSFPAMVRGEGRVAGEVFDVDDETVAAMDRFESEGRMYLKQPVQTSRGQMMTYIWNYETDNMESAPLLAGDIQHFPIEPPVLV